MDIVNELAQKYASTFSSKDEAMLNEILEYAIHHHAHSSLISGHPQGVFLKMISALLQPRKILEIGTFIGYSALCLANGLKPGGHLHTIELRSDDAVIAKNFFKRSSFYNQITLHNGNALEIIPQLKETWDLVFIDADKVNYINYYELTLPHLKTNGLIIADNVLFHGQVLATDISGKNAKAIHAFNKHIETDKRVEHVMLTVRDGLSLIRKL